MYASLDEKDYILDHEYMHVSFKQCIYCMYISLDM